MTFKRQKILRPLHANLNRGAHVLQIAVGPRQIGKTTAIHQLLEEWPERKIYATADQLTPPDVQWLAQTWRQARNQPGKKPLLVIREVDFVVQRGKQILAVEVTVGEGHPVPGLKTFLNRYPEATPVLIGGSQADLSIEQFFTSGI